MSLRFEADLVVSSDDVRVDLHGEDGVLVVTTDDAHRTWRRLRLPVPVAADYLSALGARLADHGATARIETTRGRLLVLGAGARPRRLSRFAAGPHLQIGSPAVVAAVLGRTVPVAAGALTLATVVVVRLAWVVRRRH